MGDQGSAICSGERYALAQGNHAREHNNQACWTALLELLSSGTVCMFHQCWPWFDFVSGGCQIFLSFDWTRPSALTKGAQAESAQVSAKRTISSVAPVKKFLS